MAVDALVAAVAEARRRADLADRDVTSSAEHFSAALGPVCRDWKLTAERWLPGGAWTPTLAVTTADGVPAVLKLDEPGRLDDAARVMVAAEGRGYARVLRWDAESGALLLERLGPDLWARTSSVLEQVDVAVPVLREAWRVPLEAGRPFEGKATGLLQILADLGPRYGGGHAEALFLATSYARALASSEQPEVVCHGDPHGGNLLRRGTGWALVDPDGFVGERAYDLGVLLRDACRELAVAEATTAGTGAALLRGACEHTAAQADVEPERVWRWAFVERVTTGLYLRWFGHDQESATFLASAGVLARQPGA